MKKIIILIIIVTGIYACKEKEQSLDDVITSKDLKTIRDYKAKKSKELSAINSEIQVLDSVISKLDTVEKLPLVTVFRVKDTLFKHFIELQGSVATQKNIVLYPEFSGLLKRIYVKEGQYVSKGQLLARIDDGGFSQQLAQLQVQENLAKTTFKRQQRLWEQNIGSEIQYLQAKSQYEALQKSVSQMQSQLAKTTMRAPFSGVIDEIITDQGTVVGAGQSPVMRLLNLSNMYIEAEVPETYLNSITKGKEVEAYFSVLGKTVLAKVTQSSNYIQPGNRTFKVTVSLPNKDKSIKPNLTAKLKINDYTNPNALLIYQSLISENAQGKQYVYVIQQNEQQKNIAKKTIVTTGKVQGDYVEITGGLKPNDLIIEEGARSVKDNQAVEILNR
ncbi:MAG TPA: efflux RND transporter periplasmic adaptor subunit [Saprospiraceae bacterium]|nr:efflux RND transporter periplasmic adaptor subunit [Saprospiraceae bacterium]